jgi:RNA polymerase sigma factor (sigma-70 family)
MGRAFDTDLFSHIFGDAQIALVKSVDHFDWRMGIRFSTYGTTCIIRYIDRLDFMPRGFTNCDDEVWDNRPGGYDHVQAIDEEDLRLFARSLLDSLDDRCGPKSKKVMKSLYVDGKSQKETAERFGLQSREVHNIRTSALQVIRKLNGVRNIGNRKPGRPKSTVGK